MGIYVTGYEHKLELDDVCFNDACTVRLDSTPIVTKRTAGACLRLGADVKTTMADIP